MKSFKRIELTCQEGTVTITVCVSAVQENVFTKCSVHCLREECQRLKHSIAEHTTFDSFAPGLSEAVAEARTPRISVHWGCARMPLPQFLWCTPLHPDYSPHHVLTCSKLFQPLLQQILDQGLWFPALARSKCEFESLSRSADRIRTEL